MESLRKLSSSLSKSDYEDLTAVNYAELLMLPPDQGEYDYEFANMIFEAQYAVDVGIEPELITSGSSGSYFLRNREKVSW